MRAVYILVNHKADHTKHDVGQFAHDLRVLAKMMGMSDKQV